MNLEEKFSRVGHVQPGKALEQSVKLASDILGLDSVGITDAGWQGNEYPSFTCWGLGEGLDLSGLPTYERK